MLAEQFTRQAILDAIRRRHTYAATDNIIVDFRIGDALMGDIHRSSAPPRLAVHIIGTAPIAQIDVIKNNQYVHQVKPGTNDATFEYLDNSIEPGEELTTTCAPNKSTGSLPGVRPSGSNTAADRARRNCDADAGYYPTRFAPSAAASFADLRSRPAVVFGVFEQDVKTRPPAQRWRPVSQRQRRAPESLMVASGESFLRFSAPDRAHDDSGAMIAGKRNGRVPVSAMNLEEANRPDGHSPGDRSRSMQKSAPASDGQKRQPRLLPLFVTGTFGYPKR